MGSTPSIPTFCKIILGQVFFFIVSKSRVSFTVQEDVVSVGDVRSSVVECLLCMREVLGSTPTISTFCNYFLQNNSGSSCCFFIVSKSRVCFTVQEDVVQLRM